ncbi:MAG: cvpA family protein [Rickettsiaceae bacterium]|jgi:membrane protein required for colicin V production|nr:cvpA family protein [Rickettsiaceae bacterium]
MDINPSDLNWFDITVLSVIFASTLFAVLRGFIKGIFSLFTWIASSTISVLLYKPVFSLISSHIESEKVAIAISSFGVFLVFFIILAIISSKIIYRMDGFRGSAIDRTLGLVFGLARGILIVCLVFFSMDSTSKMLQIGKEERPGPSWFTKAETYDALKMGTGKILGLLPPDVPKRLVAQIDKFKDMSTTMINNSGDEDEGNGLPRTLNPEERKVMKKLMAVLPADDMANLYKKYEGGSSGLTEIERMAIFREILTMYADAEKNGKIPNDKKISASEISKLDKALNGEISTQEEPEPTTPEAEDAGYKQDNIKQMDRLIDNVQENPTPAPAGEQNNGQ